MPANENPLPSDTEVLVTTALLARVVALESENSRLRISARRVYISNGTYSLLFFPINKITVQGGRALFRTVFPWRIHCIVCVCKTVHAVEIVDVCK